MPWPDYADGRAVLCPVHLRERIAPWLDAEFRPVPRPDDDAEWEHGADAQAVRFRSTEP